MADDRTRWLDKAAADRLLRGEPLDPRGDLRAQADAARLRDALDALTPDLRAAAATELPGEAAALAAFRAAHPARATAAVGVGAAAAAAAEEPLVAIVPVPTIAAHGAAHGAARGRAPRRAAAWRLGLAAAVAGVAIGGVATAAGTGLFDRALHLNASPLPTAEITSDVTPEPVGGTAEPSTGASRRPLPPSGGDLFGTGGARTPGPDGRTTPGATGAAAGGANNGGAGGTGAAAGTGTGTGSDNREHFGTTEGGAEGEIHDTLRGAADLCRDYRSGRLTGDRENRLNLLAKGRQKVKGYCEDLLDGTPAPRRRAPARRTRRPSPVRAPGAPPA